MCMLGLYLMHDAQIAHTAARHPLPDVICLHVGNSNGRPHVVHSQGMPISHAKIAADLIRSFWKNVVVC